MTAAAPGGMDVAAAGRDRAALALLLVLAFACAATSVADIDVWWHLASGRWILEHGRLPDADPFGVFGAANEVRTLTVLRGQWLGQVLLYGAMHAAGALGVALARAAALTGAAGIVYLRTRRLGGAPGVALAAAGICAAGLLGFPGERPQAFAFALAGLVLLAAERWERDGSPWALASVAALGGVWINVHGSVIITVAVLAAVAAVEAARFAARIPGATPGRAAAAAAVLGASTLLSPNGLTTYRYVLQTQRSELAARTTEYAGSLRIAAFGGWGLAALVLAFLGLVAVALWPLARRAPARAAATALLVAASVASYRYHAFLVVLATPWLAVALWGPDHPRRRPRPLVALLAAALLAAPVVAQAGGPLAALREPVAAGRVPAAAVARLGRMGVRGPILAWFAWSGYVLWEAWPQVVPVVDPRMLDDAALAPYTHMIWATPEGLTFLEQARVVAVLLPFQSPTGDVYALHGVLRATPGWRVAEEWPGGALYLRR